MYFGVTIRKNSRSQWPLGLRHRSVVACLLRSWVRIPPGAWIFVCCECRVLSGRGLCDKLITRPEESYRPWCIVVCDLETSRMRRPWPALGRSTTAKKYIYRKNNNVYLGDCTRTVKVSSSNRGHLSIFIEPYVHTLISICQTAGLVKPDMQTFLWQSEPQDPWI